jgi:hypothetical protein
MGKVTTITGKMDKKTKRVVAKVTTAQHFLPKKYRRLLNKFYNFIKSLFK